MSDLVQILCIDDEEQVLQGLKLSLRQLGEVHTASSGEQALAMLDSLPNLAAIICDMRMPVMAGDAVLAACRERRPLATRLLLTGYSDIDAAMRAVNSGHIFRFLNKPCPRELLHQSVHDAVEQYRLRTAEKELLEQTVQGCMQALVDALAMASPASFGQAQRMADLVRDVMQTQQLPPSWASSMAVMLANLGLVALPELLQEKVMCGLALSAAERVDVAQAHRRTWAMLAKIPRIEPVRQLLAAIEPSLHDKQQRPLSDGVMAQAAIIALVQHYAQLEASGLPSKVALATLAERYADQAQLVAILAEVLGPQSDISRQLKLPPTMLRAGMVLLDAVHTPRGLLMAPAGYVVNDSFVERLLYNCPEMKSLRFAVQIPPELVGYVHHQLQTKALDT
ncbi:response regulator receiver domain-containing protein [Paraperlucidibaca baekdonensis]|uniref:Response regulator receiver domain-containing protein n=1 Tax=Paraperlucidibaca baekdonensis TaxID=748120 RepID=A0A3E0H8Q2_9GAMM|nr:response regulator [Paraperlucidibaca baekdonensis]REH39983.1 response regulator receiver domain-containing protein [Paraperlucidibaca baekdonensis]